MVIQYRLDEYGGRRDGYLNIPNSQENLDKRILVEKPRNYWTALVPLKGIA